MRRAVVALAVLLGGCGGSEAEAPEADPALVSALAELHLADARAALDTVATDRAALAESLRAVALAAHGLDSAGLARQLDALAADPALAGVTYDALDTRLSLERQGVTPDDAGPGPRGAAVGIDTLK